MTPSSETGGTAAAGPSAVTDGAGRNPDFLIVGHEKCGTTALYRILRQHPRIFMPELKEPRFFIAERRGEEPGPPSRGGAVRPRTLTEYRALFAPAVPGQLAGEASPQYIRTPDSARLIADALPDARIIAVLREPVSFLRTFHLNGVRELVEDQRDLRQAIALEDERRQGRHLPPDSRATSRLFYGDHVRYVEQLRRFESYFGRDRMLVLIYEDFRRDNQAVVQTVLRFLGIEGPFEFEPSETKRVRKAVRMPRLHRLALSLQLAQRKPAEASALWRTLARLTPGRSANGRLREAARRAIFSVPPAPGEDLTLELRRRFKGEVVALSDYLGRDLVVEWGYDRID